MKEKKYKVVKEISSYSRKSGTVMRKVVLLKDASLVECLAYVKENYNVEMDCFEVQVPGLLYPSLIKIK